MFTIVYYNIIIAYLSIFRSKLRPCTLLFYHLPVNMVWIGKFPDRQESERSTNIHPSRSSICKAPWSISGTRELMFILYVVGVAGSCYPFSPARRAIWSTQQRIRFCFSGGRALSSICAIRSASFMARMMLTGISMLPSVNELR